MNYGNQPLGIGALYQQQQQSQQGEHRHDNQLAMAQPPMAQPSMTQPSMAQPSKNRDLTNATYNFGQQVRAYDDFGLREDLRNPITQPPMAQPPMAQPPMAQPPMAQPFGFKEPYMGIPEGPVEGGNMGKDLSKTFDFKEPYMGIPEGPVEGGNMGKDLSKTFDFNGSTYDVKNGTITNTETGVSQPNYTYSTQPWKPPMQPMARFAEGGLVNEPGNTMSILDVLKNRLQQGGSWRTGVRPTQLQGLAQANKPAPGNTSLSQIKGYINPYNATSPASSWSGPSAGMQAGMGGFFNNLGNYLGTQGVGPQSPIADQESEYDRLTGEYNALASDYDRSVRDLSYSKQAYDRQGMGWNQLEQQRGNGGGYGDNRFYHQGEIYNYDPEAGSYRGSISGQMLAQPGQYQQPELAPNPGPHEDYMADDPYYQHLEEQKAAAALAKEPKEPERPPEPEGKPPGGGRWGWNDRYSEWMPIQGGSWVNPRTLGNK